MINLDFNLSQYLWVEAPDGYNILTLDDEGNVIVFDKTDSKELAEVICEKLNA